MTSLIKCLYSGVFWAGTSSPESDPNLCWRHRGSELPTHINKGENKEPVPINGKHLIICAAQNMETVVKTDQPLSVLCALSCVFLCFSLPFSSSFSPHAVDSLLQIRGKVNFFVRIWFVYVHKWPVWSPVPLPSLRFWKIRWQNIRFAIQTLAHCDELYVFTSPFRWVYLHQ